MPRFHFHTEDGRFFPDNEGSELPDIGAAKIEALRVLGEILQHDPQEYWETEHFAIMVTDDQNKLLFAINLHPDPET